MKIKYITAAILAFITMAGIASAENININPGNQPLISGQTPPGGAFSTYNIIASNIIGPKPNTHTIKVTTTLIVSGGGSLNDLKYNFHHGASSSGWISSGNTFSWTDSAPAPIDSLTLDVMDTGTAPNTQYQFKIDDSFPLGHGTDSGEGTVYGTVPIPEKSTFVLTSIGLLGIIGLVFSKKYRPK